jgi:hypothetical protein
MHKPLIFLSTLVCGKSFHPRVEAAANTIDLDIRNNADYNGPLYVGEGFKENHLIYDTMSEWTVVMNDGASGSEFPTNYDAIVSITAKPMYIDTNKTLIDS